MKQRNEAFVSIASPLHLLVTVLGIVFLAEAVTMLILPLLLPGARSTTTAIADAFLLVVLSAPFLWWFVVRPLRSTAVAEHVRATTIVAHAVDGIITINERGVVESCNQAVENIFGYGAEEVAGKPVTDLMPERYRNAHGGGLERLRSTGESRIIGKTIEVSGLRKDGTVFPLELSLGAWKTEEGTFYTGFIRDITDRKRLEGQLRLQATALDSAANGIVITDCQGTILWVNPAYTSLTGYTPAEVLGQSTRILKSGRHDQSFYQNLWETILSGRVWHGETINRRKDGSLYTEEQTITPVRDERGAISHFIAIKQDVTERKRAEEELRRVNRALKVLSECNQALVRASDESELLNDICRIIVEDGGYQMAWVCYAEQDEGKTVRLAAYTGCEEGYLQSLAITWADSERGRGPTGSAIRTGKPCIANNTLTDPAFAPWRAEAAKRGYGSSIALPLRAEEQPIGALNIYAAEPDAFSSESEEVKRLTELAGDLEYGIAALRTRALRQQAERYQAIQFDVTRILAESATFQDAAPKLLQSICEGVGWELGELWLVKPASQLLCWKGIWHAPSLNVREFEAISRETTFPPGSSLPGRVWASGQPAWISDVCTDGNFVREAAAANLGLGGAFAFPIGSGREVTGVMAFFSCEIRQPDEYLLRVMAELGVKIGQFIRRTQAEEGRARLSAILEVTTDFVGIADIHGKVIYLNSSGRKMLGIKEDEDIANRDIADTHPEWASRIVLDEGIPTAVRDGVWSGDTALLSPDGREIPVSQVILAHKAPDGTVEFLSTIARDITERKRAEATRQALYRASIEIQEPLGLQDRLARVLQAAQTILELERANVLLADSEERWLQAVASLGTEEPLATIRVPIGPEGGAVAEAYRTRQVIVWDGGGPVPASLRLHPPYDQIAALRSRAFVVVPLVVHGRSVGVLGADRKQSRRPLDAATGEVLQLFAAQAALAIEHGRLYETQRMAAMQLEATVEARTRELQASNEQLQEVTRQAQAASRHKSAFLANMSHELRTPLNAILGFSELLAHQTYGPLTQKQARYVDNVHTSGQHLLALINDLLDLSKVEAGKLELQPQTFHLREALEAATHVFRHQAEAKQQALTFEVPADLSTITADPLRVKQILYNLLSNAVKFTPTGGRITVTARRVPSSEFGVSSSQPETRNPKPETASVSEFVEIAVADTGIGIKPDDLPKLFQPFTQLENTLTRQAQGTGLGLALTKHLVELHGGTIWAESAGEGRGSTFTLRLPQAGSGRTPRLLLVDDDEVLLATIREALEAAGYQVVAVGDGASALAAVAAHRPDLLILDLRLPSVDGWAVLRELRATLETRAFPVLAITGIDVDRGGEAITAGADEFLTKPFSLTVLESAVQRLLQSVGSAGHGREPRATD